MTLSPINAGIVDLLSSLAVGTMTRSLSSLWKVRSLSARHIKRADSNVGWSVEGNSIR